MSDFENNNYQETPAPVSQYTPVQPANSNPELDTTPISMWGYLGYLIILAIPCVNLICAIIFAVGGSKNVNLRNFGRGQLLYFALSLILSIVMMIAMGGLIASVMGEMTSIMSNPYMYY